ncbi:MAG: hypothetical protein ABI467_15425 [Kofleriaceae bacterium]
MRRWLVIPSIAFHTGLIVALLFLGAWHLDKLDAGRREVRIGYVPSPPPASEGSPAPKQATPFVHKKHVTHDLVTPPETPVKPAATEVTDPTDPTDGTGNGSGSGAGSGAGSGSGSGSNSGPCLADCGPPIVEPEPKPIEKQMIPPRVLMGLRVSGDPQIQAPGSVRSDLQWRHRDTLTAAFQVCLDASGEVSSARRLKSSGYAEYDAVLEAGIATWRYKPYTLGGHAIPVCGIVTFVYTMR